MFNLMYILKKGIFLSKKNDTIFVIKGLRYIKVHAKNVIYVHTDIVNNFDFYFSAVKSQKNGIFRFVEYSQTALHDVRGYELHQIMVPSIMEPIDAVEQYLKFFNLQEDSVVLDLGSYSGLTCILFDREISKNNINAKGRVITVEADEKSLECVKYNLNSYKTITGRTIEYTYGAIWNNDGELEFSTEGTLGASAIEVMDYCRGTKKQVPSYKLSSIAKKHSLEKIDCIKCDIEGAEAQLVEDSEFFSQFRPKIIMELHETKGNKLFNKIKTSLEKYDYEVKKVIQEDGFDFPLLECTPKKIKAHPDFSY